MTLRLQQEKEGIFFIDYGRMSEIDDGRRMFYSRDEWFRALVQLKKRGCKMHRILPNVFGVTTNYGMKNASFF